MSEKLLDVKNLHTSFFTHLGEVQAIRDVSFGLDKGEIIGIVGESGSGKSVTSLSIMGLLAYPGRVKDGEILFNGEDLLKKKKSEMRKIQGDHIAMIFQDPMTSLNPLFKIGDQITEAILTHHKIKKEDAKYIFRSFTSRSVLFGMSDSSFLTFVLFVPRCLRMAHKTAYTMCITDILFRHRHRCTYFHCIFAARIKRTSCRWMKHIRRCSKNRNQSLF